MQKIGISDYSAYGMYIYDIGNLMLDCDESLLGFSYFRDKLCEFASKFMEKLGDIADPDIITAISLASCNIYEQWSNDRSAKTISNLIDMDEEEVKTENVTFKNVIDEWVWQNSIRMMLL